MRRGSIVGFCWCVLTSQTYEAHAAVQKSVQQEFAALEKEVEQWCVAHDGCVCKRAMLIKDRLGSMMQSWRKLCADAGQKKEKNSATDQVFDFAQNKQLYEEHMRKLFVVQRKELKYLLADHTQDQPMKLRECTLVFDNDAALHAHDILEGDGIKQIFDFYKIKVSQYAEYYVLASEMFQGDSEEFAIFEQGYLASAHQRYRIYLMPLLEKIPLTLMYLFHNLQEDQHMRSLVKRIWVIKNFEQRADNPVIGIDIAQGIASAQELLNSCCRIFKESQGLDQAPRWSERISSFIFVLQGDPEHRLLEKNLVLYEPPSYAYYKDLSGSSTYRLNIPVCGQQNGKK